MPSSRQPGAPTRAKQRAERRNQPLRLILDRQTLFVALLCFLLLQVLVFTSGFLAGMVTRLPGDETGETRPGLQALMTAFSTTLPPRAEPRPAAPAAGATPPPEAADTAGALSPGTSLMEMYAKMASDLDRAGGRGDAIPPVLREHDPAGDFTIELGVFVDEREAQGFVARVRARGYTPELAARRSMHGSIRYHVWLGRFAGGEQAIRAAETFYALEGLEARAVPAPAGAGP